MMDGVASRRARLPTGWKLAFWLGVFLASLATPVFALELYSLVDANCAHQTGLIVNLTETEIFLLTLEGRLARLPRPTVQHVLVYNTLDNPISRVDSGGELGGLLRKVSLVGEEKLTFTGWPIKFFEDLIVFFDTQGNTHIYGIDKIFRIENLEEPEPEIEIANSKTIPFGLGNFLPECAGAPQNPGAMMAPTRIISDQIKIGKFLADYQTGFENLNRFQSRTVFYARPFLYEKSTIFGFPIGGDGKYGLKQLPPSFPLYIQWSSGKAYGRQALFSFGAKTAEILPNVEPLFALRTDVKAHLFTASFIGNPLGMGQGSAFMVSNRFFFTDYFSRLSPTGVTVIPHFNQLALTGLEWKGHSLSAGFYYPVIGIYGNEVFREVLSPQSSLMVRYLYTREKLRLRVIHSPFHLGSSDPSTSDIRLIPAEDMRSGAPFSPGAEVLEAALESFSLEGGFSRVGFDLDLSDDLAIGLDGIAFTGSYAEKISGVDYTLGFAQQVASFYAARRLGRRVGIRLYVNHFQNAFQFQSAPGSGQPKSSGFSLFLEVGFVL